MGNILFSISNLGLSAYNQTDRLPCKPSGVGIHKESFGEATHPLIFDLNCGGIAGGAVGDGRDVG